MPQGFTQLTAGFTQPAEGADVTISVGDSSWMAASQIVYVESGGYYEVQSIGGSTSATIRNLENTASSLYVSNAAPGAAIANGQPVTAAGLQGPTGATGVGTLNSISPTTTKGDIVADNGGNSPSAGLVRLAVGSNGKALVADSAQATGLGYATITPNTASADNAIPRFNGATGTPVPLQDSLMAISDDGALQSTPGGGDARGTAATDLQQERGASDEVASGNYAVIAGGANNKASGTKSFVGGGDTNIASGSESVISGGDTNQATNTWSTVSGGGQNIASGNSAFIGGGASNTASGNYSALSGGTSNTASGGFACVVGGTENTASATNAVIAGGQSNTASAQDAIVLGGSFATADKHGQVAHAGGCFAVAADAQNSELIFRNATTDATPTALYLNGATATARANIGSGKSWTFVGILVGRRDNGDTASWKFEGGIHNNGGTTALVGTVTASLIGADAGCAATWGVPAGVSVTADNTNDALAITVTGSVGNNIRWVCHVRAVEVGY